MNKPLRSAVDDLWMARQYLEDLSDEIRAITEQIEARQLDKTEERVFDVLADVNFAHKYLEDTLEDLKYAREENDINGRH